MNQSAPALTQRHPNRAVLWGLLVLLLAIAAAAPPFYGMNFPGQSLLPWINLGLPAIAVIFFAIALTRAFGNSAVYRGKVWGSILGVVSALLLAGSVWLHQHAKDLPAAGKAPQVGQKAPDFTLSDTSGNLVSLSQLMTTPIDVNTGKPPKAVLLVFYRGWW